MADMKEILTKLEDGVKDVWQSDKYISYLNTMSKFHDYSYNNILLILMQRPDASRVAGYRAWQTKFERNVKKGERGIQILAPVPRTKKIVNKDGDEEEIKYMTYRSVTVFDVAQTEGKELPTFGCEELVGNVGDYDAIMAGLKAQASIPVETMDIEDGAKGWCSATKIAIKRGMSELQTVKTMIHELAHHLMGHISKDNTESREAQEIQAESVAYVVSQAIGLDTSDYSFAYVAGWAGQQNADALKSVLTNIQKTASKIIDGLKHDTK